MFVSIKHPKNSKFVYFQSIFLLAAGDKTRSRNTAFLDFAGGNILMERDPTISPKLGLSFKLVSPFLGIYPTEVKASLL